MITAGDLAGRLTCSVEEAGQALGIGRSAAYAAARRGQIPTLPLGRALRVPVPKLLELVGLTPDSSEAGDSTSPATAQTSINLTEEPSPHGAHDIPPASSNVRPLHAT